MRHSLQWTSSLPGCCRSWWRSWRRRTGHSPGSHWLRLVLDIGLLFQPTGDGRAELPLRGMRERPRSGQVILYWQGRNAGQSSTPDILWHHEKATREDQNIHGMFIMFVVVVNNLFILIGRTELVRNHFFNFTSLDLTGRRSSVSSEEANIYISPPVTVRPLDRSPPDGVGRERTKTVLPADCLQALTSSLENSKY